MVGCCVGGGIGVFVRIVGSALGLHVGTTLGKAVGGLEGLGEGTNVGGWWWVEQMAPMMVQAKVIRWAEQMVPVSGWQRGEVLMRKRGEVSGWWMEEV